MHNPEFNIDPNDSLIITLEKFIAHRKQTKPIHSSRAYNVLSFVSKTLTFWDNIQQLVDLAKKDIAEIRPVLFLTSLEMYAFKLHGTAEQQTKYLNGKVSQYALSSPDGMCKHLLTTYIEKIKERTKGNISEEVKYIENIINGIHPYEEINEEKNIIKMTAEIEKALKVPF